MEFTRSEHIRFLDLELLAQTKQYIETIQRSAVSLLERDEVFSSQFVRIEDGLLILKFKNNRTIPRKGEYLTAILLNGNMSSYHNWGNISWAELRNRYQIEFSEAICVFHSNTPDQEFSIAGFRGVTFDFAERLQNNCIVILGPKEPPRVYLQNLIKVVSRNSNEIIDRILDFDVVNNDWIPISFNEKDDFVSFVLNQMSLSHEVMIQGPPGTGKTTKMAELSAYLLNQGKSVLATALTNRALIELASKSSLKSHLEEERIYKTNVTIDEKHKLPKLLNEKNAVCKPGALCLSTFYKTSDFATDIVEIPPFDYIIMDEASQAFLAMFACSKLLGKNVIWIGDPNQLPPITIIGEEIIKRKGFVHLIEGFNTICKNLTVPSFILTDSYRLTTRSAEYTSLFYNNKIISKLKQNWRLTYSEITNEINRFFHPLGGPTLLKISMPIGDCKPEMGIKLVIALLLQLTKVNEKKFEVAVLTKLKKTVKELQKNVTSILGNDKNILIDTIERVQGLTCDVCIFLIPNAMQNRSLDKPLFNVATSRAKRHTIIIVDSQILTFPFADNQVTYYLSRLNEEYSFNADLNFKMILKEG